ncbi:hypothetical protein Dimus_026856 [Dionaea muscipula]
MEKVGAEKEELLLSVSQRKRKAKASDEDIIDEDDQKKRSGSQSDVLPSDYVVERMSDLITSGIKKAGSPSGSDRGVERADLPGPASSVGLEPTCRLDLSALKPRVLILEAPQRPGS